MANKVSYTFSISDRFSGPARRIGNSTAKVRRRFRALTLDAKKLSAGMTTASTKMRSTSLAAGVTIGGSLKAFGDMEQGVSNVITLLDDDAAVQKFGGSIKGLSQEAVLMGFSIQDANKGLFDTVSALGANQTAWDAYGTAQRLAIAGVTDLSVSTDGLTSILNAYKGEIENTDDVANAFFTAQKKGKTTVAALAQNIGKVAPIAKQAGIGYKELLATTAQLTLGGLSTEESTTALRQAINALIKPSKQAEKVLRKMRVPIGATELREKGLGFALTKLAETAERYPDLLAEAIPNIRAFTAAASLGTDEIANIDAIVKQINTDIESGTGLQDAFNKQQSTFNRQMARTWGSIKILGGLIGEAMAPFVQGMGAFVRGIIAGFKVINPAIRSMVVVILALVAAAAPLLAIFGQLGTVVAWLTLAGAATLGSVLFIIVGIGAGILTIVKHWKDLKREFATFDFSESFGYLKELIFGENDVNVTGGATSTSQSELTVNFNAPKGMIQSTKLTTSGSKSGLKTGVNVQEGL